MTDFGPAQTIKISELRVGDFVVEIPTQQRVRGLRVMSAVKTRRLAIEGIDGTWTTSPGYRRRRQTVSSHVMTFASGTSAGWNYPDSFDVIVRRPADYAGAAAIYAQTPAPQPARQRCTLCGTPTRNKIDDEPVCIICDNELHS